MNKRNSTRCGLRSAPAPMRPTICGCGGKSGSERPGACSTIRSRWSGLSKYWKRQTKDEPECWLHAILTWETPMEELIASVAQKTGLDAAKARQAVETVLN